MRRWRRPGEGCAQQGTHRFASYALTRAQYSARSAFIFRGGPAWGETDAGRRRQSEGRTTTTRPGDSRASRAAPGVTAAEPENSTGGASRRDAPGGEARALAGASCAGAPADSISGSSSVSVNSGPGADTLRALAQAEAPGAGTVLLEGAFRLGAGCPEEALHRTVPTLRPRGCTGMLLLSAALWHDSRLSGGVASSG